MCIDCSVNWLDHSRTFREQGVEESETLLLRRKFFYSDQNVDSRDPVQLNLLYVQVNNHTYLHAAVSKKQMFKRMTYCSPIFLLFSKTCKITIGITLQSFGGVLLFFSKVFQKSLHSVIRLNNYVVGTICGFATQATFFTLLMLV